MHLEVLVLKTYILVLRESVEKVMERIRLIEKYWSKYYCSDYYDVSVNEYGVKCRTSLRFGENRGWINEIDSCGWFQWYFRYWLGRRPEDDKKNNRWKTFVSRFRDKLVKLFKDAGSKFGD